MEEPVPFMDQEVYLNISFNNIAIGDAVDLMKEIIVVRELSRVSFHITDPIEDEEETPVKETHNEETLHKVYRALHESLDEQGAIDAVARMQNAGILFRERVKED